MQAPSQDDRDYELREREIRVKEGELELKRRESAISRWTNPLVLAVLGATAAGLGNAYVLLRNVELEDRKAEQSRILQVIKTDDIKQAAKNLNFLVSVGLISSPTIKEQVRSYLASVGPDGGPALPRDYGSYTSPTYDTGTTFPVSK